MHKFVSPLVENGETPVPRATGYLQQNLIAGLCNIYGYENAIIGSKLLSGHGWAIS